MLVSASSALSTAVGPSAPAQKKSACHFNEQKPESIINAVNEFEKRIDYFDVQFIRKHAEKFNRKNYEDNMKQFVIDKLEKLNS